MCQGPSTPYVRDGLIPTFNGESLLIGTIGLMIVPYYMEIMGVGSDLPANVLYPLHEINQHFKNNGAPFWMIIKCFLFT